MDDMDLQLLDREHLQFFASSIVYGRGWRVHNVLRLCCVGTCSQLFAPVLASLVVQKLLKSTTFMTSLAKFAKEEISVCANSLTDLLSGRFV